MGRSLKNIKNEAIKKDFTFQNVNRACIRFNRASVVTVVINREALTATIQLTDEIENKKYNLVGNLEISEG